MDNSDVQKERPYPFLNLKGMDRVDNQRAFQNKSYRDSSLNLDLGRQNNLHTVWVLF